MNTILTFVGAHWIYFGIITLAFVAVFYKPSVTIWRSKSGRFSIMLCLATLAAGCQPVLTAAVVTVNQSHEAIVKTHDALEQIDAGDQKACVDSATTKEIGETCLAATRAKYATAWAAYVKVRLAWLIAYAAVNTAVNVDSWGRVRPDLSSMLQALEGLGDAWGEFSSLIGRKP